jgi:hypothetical protein
LSHRAGRSFLLAPRSHRENRKEQQVTIYNLYGRRASANRPAETPLQIRKTWDRLRDFIADEHRVIQSHEPNSPRIKPSVGVVGFILAGGVR